MRASGPQGWASVGIIEWRMALLSSGESRAAGLSVKSPASVGYLGRSTDALSSMKLAGDEDSGVISLKGPHKSEDTMILSIETQRMSQVRDHGEQSPLNPEEEGARRSSKVLWDFNPFSQRDFFSSA